MRKAVVAGLLAVLIGPASLLLAMAVLLNPSAKASCLPSTGITHGSPEAPFGHVGETSRVVFPLPAGTWVNTSGFGMRVHPITGVHKLHTGVDLAARAGTHILAAADGKVAFAGPAAGYGSLILIEHTVNGKKVASGYAHMYAAGIHVHAGETVSAGQYIADVGMAGYATGPHLHFEIRPGGPNSAPINPEPWLAAKGAVPIESGAGGDAGCAAAAGGPATSYAAGNPDHLVDDPSTAGQITERTAHILAQLQANFPRSAWSCWAPRTGARSEHPLGRACDGTFGNSIGTSAKGVALDLGWQVTNWMKSNAATLGVEYLIWQGHIWSVPRSSEGWRPYNGAGMFDPKSVTGGHFDHLHWTAEQ